MKTTIGRWGNSLAVRIPASLAQELKLSDGDALELSAEKGGFHVSPVKRPLTMEDLLVGVTPENSRYEDGPFPETMTPEDADWTW